MPTHAESNACSACARSKRKCGRQMPSCTRCVDKGRSCVYPPSRPRAAFSSRPSLSDASKSSVPGLVDGLLAEGAGNISIRTEDLILADNVMLDMTFPLMESDYTGPSSLIQASDVQMVRVDWFLAPETWRITQRFAHSVDVPISRATMKKYVAVLQSWIQRWVAVGSNPFIHSCLYSVSSPACVQVAYATLASYIHRTSSNTESILEIVEDRSNTLLQENGAIRDMVVPDQWADAAEQDADLFAQLTRLHALIVYQLIGLFDGDIRSRHVAEGHIVVQNSWAGKLFHSAGKALSDSHAGATHLVGCLPSPSTVSQQQWYLWILSESIRRTWLVAASLAPVFTALQQRGAPCPGGIMYTNRSGLWDAASATEWEKQCLEKNVAFLQRFECVKLLDETEPADVDEFSTAMLDMTVHSELLEKWRNRSSRTLTI